MLNRPFTQNGFDHVWLDEKSYNRLLKRTVSVVSSSESSHQDDRLRFLIEPKSNVTYVHSRASFDTSNSIALKSQHPIKKSSNSMTVGLGYGDISYNVASKAFRDYFEFGELTRGLALNPDFPTFAKRKFMVTFLPDCNLLPPSHIDYIIRLSKIVELDVFGGCPEAVNSKTKLQIPNFSDKMRLVGSYKYILVVEPSNDPYFVSEVFFESLVYDSMPVVIGAVNLKPYLPDDDAVVNARDFIEPRRLAHYLQSLPESEWLARLNWKKMVNNRKPEFSKLWGKGIESVICTICKMSDPKPKSESAELLQNHGAIDNGKLLMYLDQRRWYKEKKRLRKERHARKFKDGILQ